MLLSCRRLFNQVGKRHPPLLARRVSVSLLTYFIWTPVCIKNCCMERIKLEKENRAMKFGYFDDANREYVITTPKTPLPWINYLGCKEFFTLISNTCGGYTFYKDAKLLRLTRYRYNDVPYDTNGKYFYIKDGDTIWNPGWQPTKTELDSYECRHGIGYSRFTASKNDVQASVLTFVPMNDNCEISQVKKIGRAHV